LSRLSFLRRPLWAAAALFVLVASAWIAHRSNTEWDYPIDAGPPIDALVHLRLHDFFAARPAMGPLSLVFRAPFAAIGQAVGQGGPDQGYLDDYRFGVFGCLVTAGIFGIALGRVLEGRGFRWIHSAFVVIVAVVNPVTLRAVHFGHPEEVFGAALLAGAMLAVVVRRPWLAAVLIALTVLNKQWGVVAAPTVIVALGLQMGWRRLRGPAYVLLGILALLVVPLLLVDASSLFDTTKRLVDLRGTYVFPADIWYGIAPDLPPAKAALSQTGLRDMPDWLGLIARPLIVAMGLVMPLLFMRRMRENVTMRAPVVLALVMLLRCALDPADNGYYHAPFVLALLVADALSGRYYATVAAIALTAAPTVVEFSPQGLSAFYSVWAPLFVVYLVGRAYGFDWSAWVRNRGVRGQAAAPPVR
jgi:hypothetical protein